MEAPEQEEREEATADAAPEGTSEEARPDEDDVQDPDAEQQDPESGPASGPGPED